jgi:hypothetical protein
MSQMQVTPGFGAAVATELKGNAHHQRVIVHEDAVRTQVIPAVSAAAYSAGKCVGGELLFEGLARFVGDVAKLETVQVILKGASTPADLDLVIYPNVLNTPPVNGDDFLLLGEEAADVLAVVSIKAADFRSVGGQMFASVALPVPALLQAAAGTSTLRGALVARGALVPFDTDSLVLTLTARRS